MNRWYKHAALLAVLLGPCLEAHAQQEIPTPVGAARIAEPLGYCPAPEPMLVPGPMTPAMAPIGPPDCLSLPSGHSSAFQCENYTTENRCYASVGAIALRRQHVGSEPIVFLDTQSAGLDTGVSPLGNLPGVFGLDQFDTIYRYGYKVTLGYLFGDQALELDGFYLPQTTRKYTSANQGQLFVPFAGPGGAFPIGFEGNAGLWNQADQVVVGHTSTLGSLELNYRSWNAGISGFDFICGVRYLYAQEQINIFTDDEFFVRDVFGNPDPLRQGAYSTTTRNNILAIQVGGEYSAPVPWKWMGWLWFTGMAKAGIGPNLVERTFKLTRGDKFEGFDESRESVTLGQVYEAAVYADVHMLERLRLRVGYTALMAVGVSVAGSQVNFDLSNPSSRPRDYGSMFWHGPVAELQLLF